MKSLSALTITRAMEVLSKSDDLDLIEAAHQLWAMNEAVPLVNRTLQAAEQHLLFPTFTREADLQQGLELARVYYSEPQDE